MGSSSSVVMARGQEGYPGPDRQWRRGFVKEQLREQLVRIKE